MKILAKVKIIALIGLVFFALDANAAINSSDVLDNVLARYQAAAAGWAGIITNNASWLYWTLVLISMVWTFGMLALRKADIGEFFAELVRFTIFTGFFWWLLINGPTFANSIIASLRQLGGNATGLGSALSPSGVVDVGFAIFDRVVDQSSLWSPVNSAAGIIIAVIILVILALVGVNMLVLLVSGWILAYAGVFFLGFGGSRWTSDMAINYYKTVLGIAAQLFVMVLIVGIGKTFLDDYYGSMSLGITIKEMGVMLIVGVILLMLVNKLPNLVAGIISGGHAGMSGIGQAGVGTALGGLGMATAAAATGGAMIAAGAANAAGGAQALMTAFSKASENVSSGSDVLTSMGGGGGSLAGAGQSESDSGSIVTPFSQAAGFGHSGGANMSDGSLLSHDKSEGINDKGESGDSKAQEAKGGSQATEKGYSAKGNQQGEGSNSGVLASAAKGGKIVADAGMNLAKGMTEMAKTKAAGFKESTQNRIADTAGGRLAAEISNLGVNTQNSLSRATKTQVDPESEVAAFRDKGQRKS